MPKSSQDNQLGDGSRLLKAVRESEHELPGIGRYAASLGQMQSRVMKSRRQRDSLVASARSATLRMNADFKAYREAVSAMRNFIKSVLGQHSEKLIRYGIRPVPKGGGVRGGLPN
ncbi:MAG TPA: hypothetical protein VKM72_07405 [Thermoanaerobaculia bacterium]|nr:hypothetical protein [Thermoanaerobaculia bacterium]